MSNLLYNKLINQEVINNVSPPDEHVLAWLQQDGDKISWYVKSSNGSVKKISSDGDVSKKYVDEQLTTKLADPGVGKAGQFLMKTASGTKWADCSGSGSVGASEVSPVMTFSLDNPVGGGAPGEGLTILKRPKFSAISSTKFEKEINSENISNPIEG